MSALAGALLAGCAAGLGVAMPLGPVGAYLISISADRGLRAGASGALGIASVDAGFALAASLAGVPVAHALAPLTRWLQLGAALVLVGLGWQILRARDKGRPAAGASGATFFRFAGLTTLNPSTVVYFLALVLGLAHRGRVAVAAFVFGVFLASLAWQLALVGLGRGLHRLPWPGWTLRLGSAVIIWLLAAWLLV